VDVQDRARWLVGVVAHGGRGELMLQLLLQLVDRHLALRQCRDGACGPWSPALPRPHSPEPIRQPEGGVRICLPASLQV
jgi:hypothetical protein